MKFRSIHPPVLWQRQGLAEGSIDRKAHLEASMETADPSGRLSLPFLSDTQSQKAETLL